MKILVLSDSHSTLSFMRRCIDTVKPDVLIHLGDHYDDGEAMAEEYPRILLYQVPGNCDRYRCRPGIPEIMIPRIGGVDVYMTHGHKHSVKSYLGSLLRDARKANAGLVLYGHTHILFEQAAEVFLVQSHKFHSFVHGQFLAVMQLNMLQQRFQSGHIAAL